jgi:uncharacterized metal-binding protein
MPSGRTHDRITLWFLPVVAGLAATVTQRSYFALIVCAGFLWGGLMLGPDLDTHSVHYKRWGWLRWIWLPYRSSIKHRSPWSHSPFLGTTIRVLYLMIWIGIFSLVGVATVNEIGQFGLSWVGVGDFWSQLFQRYQQEAMALFVGLELGAFSHYTADWLVSTRKRVRSKGWQAAFSRSKKRRRSRKR